MARLRIRLSLILSLVALCLLIPGVTQPVLSLQGTIEKAKLAESGIEMITDESDQRSRRWLRAASSMLGLNELEGEILVYQKTRSIWGTINELYSNGNLLVAVLVALFSIVVPVIKLLAQCAYVLVGDRLKRSLVLVIQMIGKWSMADVFVIAIIIAYLAGNADGQMGEMLIMQAEVGPGFWYFTSYCITAIAASMILIMPISKPKNTSS